MTHPMSDGCEAPAASVALPTRIAMSAGEPWGHSQTARQAGADATSSGLVGLGAGSNKPTDSTKATGYVASGLAASARAGSPRTGTTASASPMSSSPFFLRRNALLG